MDTRATVTKARGVVRTRIELPTNAENVYLGVADGVVNLRKLRAVLVGSSTPSVTIQLFHGPNRDGTGATAILASPTAITSTTTGSTILAAAMASVTIPNDDWVWLTTTAQSGTVAELGLTLFHRGNL